MGVGLAATHVWTLAVVGLGAAHARLTLFGLLRHRSQGYRAKTRAPQAPTTAMKSGLALTPAGSTIGIWNTGSICGGTDIALPIEGSLRTLRGAIGTGGDGGQCT